MYPKNLMCLLTSAKTQPINILFYGLLELCQKFSENLDVLGKMVFIFEIRSRKANWILKNHSWDFFAGLYNYVGVSWKSRAVFRCLGGVVFHNIIMYMQNIGKSTTLNSREISLKFCSISIGCLPTLTSWNSLRGCLTKKGRLPLIAWDI